MAEKSIDLNTGTYKSQLLEPFIDAVLPEATAEDLEKLTDVCMDGFGQGMDRDKVRENVKRIQEDEHRAIVFMNDIYQVNVRSAELRNENFPPMLHLSVKRRDKSPIDINHWRILQEIKNVIVGLEYEGVEIFPADSRLIDTANQYHLWVFAQEGRVFPFGYFSPKTTRTAEEASKCGAVQRD